jgi:hypothetical protein
MALSSATSFRSESSRPAITLYAGMTVNERLVIAKLIER